MWSRSRKSSRRDADPGTLLLHVELKPEFIPGVPRLIPRASLVELKPGFIPGVPQPIPRASLVELKPGFIPGVPQRLSYDSRQPECKRGANGGILTPPCLYCMWS